MDLRSKKIIILGDRDGEDILHVTNWNKRIYSKHRLLFDYTSTKN